ncbi:MAG: hypothetical protein RL260_2449 [Pseudomonadota bacterium]|jgi:hypothetical protein
MNTPEDEPSTSDLLNFYSEQAAKAKGLKAELVQVDAILEGLAEILLERIPEGLSSMAHVTPTGTKLTVKRKVSERFQPAAGKSPEFWDWVQSTGQWSMVTRTVLQTGVTAYLAEHGTLPPAIEKVSKETAGITVTIGAPRA